MGLRIKEGEREKPVMCFRKREKRGKRTKTRTKKNVKKNTGTQGRRRDQRNRKLGGGGKEQN